MKKRKEIFNVSMQSFVKCFKEIFFLSKWRFWNYTGELFNFEKQLAKQQQ